MDTDAGAIDAEFFQPAPEPAIWVPEFAGMSGSELDRRARPA